MRTEEDLQRDLKSLEEFRKRILSTPGAAVKFLQEAGILDENGDLRKEYQ